MRASATYLPIVYKHFFCMLLVTAFLTPFEGSAAGPAIQPVPRSLHLIYSVTRTQLEDKKQSTYAAEYWTAAPNSACWTRYGKFPDSRLTDGTVWIVFSLPKVRPSLEIYPARSWDASAPGVYDPGVVAGDIPFLGFGQPGKLYTGQKTTMVKIPQGWEQHSQVPQGYAKNSQTGQPDQVEAVLTYDQWGRLVKFERNPAGDNCETYTYSHFAKLGSGVYLPQTVEFVQRFRDAKSGVLVADYSLVYQVTAMDTKPVVKGFFGVQHPPTGTSVQDYRFSDGGTSRLLSYVYSGKFPIDEESKIVGDVRRGIDTQQGH